MTIDRLGEKTILVTLMRDDMQRYDLDFETAADGAGTRRGLTRLMIYVGEECGLDHRGKSYLIEALPGKDSCLLIISVRTNKPRRRYRIKRVSGVDCCRFGCVDDLLDWLSRPESDRLSYSLYKERDCYYLLPEFPLTASERGILNEYGSVAPESPVAVARLREHGVQLRGVSRRRRHFKYASSAAI